MGNKKGPFFLLILLIITVIVLTLGFGYINTYNSFDKDKFLFNEEYQKNGFYQLSVDQKTLNLITKLDKVSEDKDKVYAELTTKNKTGMNRTKFVVFDPKLDPTFVIEKTTKTNEINTTPPTFLNKKSLIYNELKKLEGTTMFTSILLSTSLEEVNLNKYENYIKCNQKFYKSINYNSQLNCDPYLNQIRIYDN